MVNAHSITFIGEHDPYHQRLYLYPPLAGEVLRSKMRLNWGGQFFLAINQKSKILFPNFLLNPRFQKGLNIFNVIQYLIVCES